MYLFKLMLDLFLGTNLDVCALFCLVTDTRHHGGVGCLPVTPYYLLIVLAFSSLILPWVDVSQPFQLYCSYDESRLPLECIRK